jgi:hypothetical protein
MNVYSGMVEGKFPKRALRHVLEWYDLHREELIDNWLRCQKRESPNPIEPLE